MENKEQLIESSNDKCESFCGMNYCDDNGCIERKRILVDPIELIKNYNNEDI